MNIQPWENTIGEIEKEKELDRVDMSSIRREGGGHSRHVQEKKRGREGDQIVDQAWEILIPHVTIQRRRCYKKNTKSLLIHSNYGYIILTGAAITRQIYF